MATMFPAHVDAFTTSGENLTWHFLQRAARPDREFLCWYEPDIEEREPDFILYSPDCGLIVLEVKDWVVKQILEANPKIVLLSIGDREERRKNPVAQAKEYRNRLLSLLGRSPVGNQGQSPCPVAICVVLPHISRDELREHGLQQVFSEDTLICWDELQDHSPLLRDASGQQFRDWLKAHFPPLFPFSLTQSALNGIRAAIFPQVCLSLPRRQTWNSQNQSETLLALDHDQENLARTFGPGRHLIVGPAGSGRTLILAYQAWHLPRVSRNIKRILFVCFNLSLVGYIRRLLAQKGVCLGPDGVEVLPFYSLCERILGETLAHSAETEDFYSLVVQETLERLDGSHPLQHHWDAVLVDEGQDFSADMAQVLLRLVPPHGTLTVVQDDNQRLYQKDATGWQNMGIPLLQVRYVRRQYRNSKQIAQLATRILGIDAGKNSFLGWDGSEPSWLVSKDASGQVRDVAEAVADLVRQGCSMNEIAILYARSQVDDVACLPEELVSALEARGILARWIARDTASKRGYDITTDSVTISTIYSAKGLDFAVVFLLGLDRLNAGKARDRRLAYVGVTRAREHLTLAICEDCDECRSRWGLI